MLLLAVVAVVFRVLIACAGVFGVVLLCSVCGWCVVVCVGAVVVVAGVFA